LKKTIDILLLAVMIGGIGTSCLLTYSLRDDLDEAFGQLLELRSSVRQRHDAAKVCQAGHEPLSAALSGQLSSMIDAAINDAWQGIQVVDDAPRGRSSSVAETRGGGAAAAVWDPDTIQAALSRASQVLAEAVARGAWDVISARQFTAALHGLPAGALAQAYRGLSQAVNEGELQLPNAIDPALVLGSVDVVPP